MTSGQNVEIIDFASDAFALTFALTLALTPTPQRILHVNQRTGSCVAA